MLRVKTWADASTTVGTITCGSKDLLSRHLNMLVYYD